MADHPDPEAVLDLTVAELLDRWPAAAAAFIEHRLACLGCSFCTFDTTRQALEIHDVPLERFLPSLRAALALPSSNPSTAPTP